MKRYYATTTLTQRRVRTIQRPNWIVESLTSPRKDSKFNNVIASLFPI